MKWTSGCFIGALLEELETGLRVDDWGAYAANQYPLLFGIGMIGKPADSLFPRFFESAPSLVSRSSTRFNVDRRNVFLDAL